MGFAVDGSALDIAALALGVLFIFPRPIRRWRRKAPECFTTHQCIADFLTGMTVMPFLLLSCAVLSSEAVAEITRSNKVYVSAAGVIGLIFIFQSIFVRD